MARGKHKKGKPSHSKKRKIFPKKSKTEHYQRDIKHVKQYDEYYRRKRLEEEKQKKKKETKIELRDSDEDDQQEAPDLMTQLLSTFSNEKGSKPEAIESDDEEEEYDSDETNDKNIKEKEDNSVQDDAISDKLEAEQEELDDEDRQDIVKEELETNTLDPFHQHFAYDLDEPLLQVVSTVPWNAQTTKIYWPLLHTMKVELPCVQREQTNKQKLKVTVEEEKVYAKEGNVPACISKIDWKKLFVKSQIEQHISRANAKQLGISLSSSNCEALTPLQKELFSIINNYQDLQYCERTLANGEEVRFIYCLHVINHILKTRLKIIHHNERILKKSKEEVPDDFRDQGLVRPKVIILVPFRDSCLRLVNMFISILLPGEKANVINRKRFNEEFSGSELAMPKKHPKPEDYEETFTGNTDDTFKVGISVTKKSLKLYTDFYSSDIIVASPLGLRIIIGAEGEKERDYDFLASVELLILDQAEIFFMQNWDHLLHIFDHLHLQPRETHGTDFSRIRSWALSGWTKYYRQTLMFSSITLPDLNALFNRRCLNYAGKVKVDNPVETGSISQVIVQIPEVFHKFKANSVTESINARFDYFVNTILPQYKDSIMSGVLIYIPSYFDYVKLRNYFKREELNFTQICEYSKDGKIAKARDMFFHNEKHFLLYSERFHFFRRIRLKGIRHVIFYQPPTFPHFYSEICNLMQDAYQNHYLFSDTNRTVAVLYCKYDVHQLAAIVNTARTVRMIASDKNVHMFATK